jgi:hypothetical protein
MCPTPIGRIHTRVATIVMGPAVLGLIVTLVSGHLDWIVLIGVYLLLGVFLDTAVYSWLLKYQPPWMTFVLGLAEYGLLLAATQVLEGFPNISVVEATVFYWVSWVLAISLKIALLPIISLTYLESAGEFRHIQWSIPPQQVALPVLASTADAGPGQVLREASGVHAVPLRPLPAPSGVHAVPAGPGPTSRRGAPLAELIFVEESPSKGTERAVAPGATIGRRDCDVVIADREVSRRHAVIRATVQGFVLEDLDSSNGTFVNGRRIAAPHPLTEGDEVQFGDTVWRLGSLPAARATAPFSPPPARAAGGSAARRAGATLFAAVVVALTAAGVVAYYIAEPFK